MAGVKNLDMLIPGWVEITTPEKVYRLRDDVGTLIGLYAFRLGELEKEIGEKTEREKLSIAQIAEAYAVYEREVLEACVGIFRATPEFAKITEEEVARILAPMQRMELIKAFLSIRLSKSQTPASAPSASVTASTTTEPASAPPSADSSTVTGGPSDRDGTKRRKR